MAPRRLIVLLIALLVGVGTMMLARSSQAPVSSNAVASADHSQQAPARQDMVQILVAAQDIPAGTLLKDGDMRWQTWPQNAMSDTFIVKGQKEAKDYVGSVVRQGVRKDEPLTTNRIVQVHEQGFLAAVLTPGMRAITIPITPASGVAGFAFPGDHVDVIVTHKVTHPVSDGRPADEHKVSETVLSDVRVLALDQKTNDQAKEAKPAQLATLEVTPAQAEQLALVVEMGTLSLVLRSIGIPDSALKLPADDSSTYTMDADVSHVMPKPSNRSGQMHRVQIMRGKETSDAYFDAR